MLLHAVGKNFLISRLSSNRKMDINMENLATNRKDLFGSKIVV